MNYWHISYTTWLQEYKGMDLGDYLDLHAYAQADLRNEWSQWKLDNPITPPKPLRFINKTV